MDIERRVFMSEFSKSQEKILSFMEQVALEKELRDTQKAYESSTDYKLDLLNKEEERGKGVCLDKIFSQLYKDALPLNDDYKVAHGEDLDAEIKDFISTRCPKGMEYYVHEGIRKGSKAAEKIMEGVEKIVHPEIQKKGLEIEEYDPKELVFRMTDDTQKKVDLLKQDLNLDDVSQIVRDNVKSTVLSEIERAKKEKEELKELESELAQNMAITDEAAIDDTLLYYGFTENQNFEPTLFQGLMIGNTDKYTKMEETAEFTPEYTFGALEEFGYNYTWIDGATPPVSTVSEMAFIESVKELTRLNLVQALKLERFTPDIVKDMAYEYAKQSA